ncbi:hypothetical protein BV898_05345 [Hypsibius exemplaris]|uniref:Uncharacterized protein n=1 Tax=Hypsibius exemplaris TaxID=2072580 RepID=A0A1W0X031_HYPEX|nr:hypothetical protein BV898_05345 [Hypsibius exemplaris]
MIIAGSGSPSSLGYDTMGSAYDIAIDKAGELYPDIFRSFSVTRHFTSGKFSKCSCADATGETIVALGNFCTINRNFKEDITVIASVATLGLLDDKRRFPTVLPFGGISYNKPRTGYYRVTVLAARNVNAVSIPLDSNTDAAIETALQSCSTRSSVTVLASIFPELYVTILEAAFRLRLADGHHVR